MQFSGKQNVYLEIARRYRDYIQLGLLKPGEKLPSVREAATELGVNPNTVARAYALLESEGYLHSLPKKGLYVTYGEAADPAASAEGEEKKAILHAWKGAGIEKETVLAWIEEVYKDD